MNDLLMALMCLRAELLYVIDRCHSGGLLTLRTGAKAMVFFTAEPVVNMLAY